MNTRSYDRITEPIVALLRQGTVPWHKPWNVTTGLPRNLVTKRPYQGINTFLLIAMGYESPNWLTFRQSVQLGGNVKKGEKSCPVVFWKPMEVENRQSGETEKIPFLRLYHVFNVAQCEGLKNVQVADEAAFAVTRPAQIVAKMPEPPLIKHGMREATRQEVITASRKRYGTLRKDIEASLRESMTAGPVASRPRVMAVVMPPPPPAPEPEAEVPTVSENKVEPPRDLGRGGAQHQAIQQRIKKAAEELGFRSIIEKVVLDKLGSVDLLLERDGKTMACEISISTTIDHEVRNVSKCLKAGFSEIAIICLDDERLRKIETAVSSSLGPEAATCVKYFQPDPFIAHLKSLKQPTLPPSETMSSGYKVRRSVPKYSQEERRQKEDIANRIIAETMRPKR